MLQRIKSALTGEKTLHSSHYMEIIETTDTYEISEKRTDLSVTFNGETYEVNGQMSIPKKVTDNSNIIVEKYSEVNYIIGDQMSDSSITCYFPEEQLLQIDDIEVTEESSQSVFENAQYTVSVQKLDSMWCVEISGFKTGLEYKLDVVYADMYPRVWVREIAVEDNPEFEFSGLDKRKTRIDIDSGLSGIVRVNRQEVDICDISGEVFTLNTVVSESIITEQDSFEEDIERWNTKAVTVEVVPDTHSVVKKEQTPSDELTELSFALDEFTKLGTLNVEYPDHVSVSPYLSYPNRKDFMKPTARQSDNTVVFEDCVPPGEDIRLHSNTFTFEDGSTKLDFAEGESKTISLSPTQKRAEFYLENDLNTEAFCEINDVNIHISVGESEEVKIKLSEENHVKITDGATVLLDTELSRKELLSTKTTLSAFTS